MRQEKPYKADKVFVIFEDEAGQRGCLSDLTKVKLSNMFDTHRDQDAGLYTYFKFEV